MSKVQKLPKEERVKLFNRMVARQKAAARRRLEEIKEAERKQRRAARKVEEALRAANHVPIVSERRVRPVCAGCGGTMIMVFTWSPKNGPKNGCTVPCKECRSDEHLTALSKIYRELEEQGIKFT